MGKSDITIEDKKCMTPEFRTSYPNVFKAKSFEGQEPKYGLTMLFSKKADISKLKKAAFNAAVEKWGEDKAKWPKKLRLPFRDGDAEKADMKGYPGHIFVSASSKQKPGVVDQRREAILDEQAFYAGCYARATLIAFAYDRAGNVGVSFSLQNVQKLRDGERFSGRKAAEDEFDAVEDASDDASAYGKEAEADLGF